MTLKRYTAKRTALNRLANKVREELKAEVRRCEVCLRSRDPEFLAGHEICNGNGLRLKGLDKRFAILLVCRYPNFITGERCHDTVQNESETRQLARLLMVRGGDYDLKAYLLLTRPNAPHRITQEEVDAEVQNLLGEK